MLNPLKQNKQVISVAFSLFIVSMSTLMFFMGSNQELSHGDIKTNVVGSLHSAPTEEREKNYRKVLHSENDPFVILTLEGKVEFQSENFVKNLGLSEEDVSHKLFPLLLKTDDIPVFLKAFDKIREDHQPLAMVGPYHLRDINGQERAHMGSLIPIMEKEKIKEIALITKDIEKETLPSEQSIPQKTEGKKIQNGGGKGERLMAGVVVGNN